MKVASVLGWLSACALGAVALAPSGCTCTEVGCWGSVSTTLMVQGDIESLEDAIVTICRGESCAEGRLVPASDGKQLTCDFGDGAATGERGCQASTEGDEVAVAFSFAFDADEEPEESFRFAVSSSSDAADVLAEREGVPEYESSSPNGEWCGPTCYNGTL